ncbi:MAG: tetratricopeptide repeat protein [Rubrivivax sp.]|nr:tetratricopeptide repeat protein [Rubrivivax sp.]
MPHRLLCCALALWFTCAGPAVADGAADVQALLARGDLAAALQRAERAITENPRDPHLRFLHGVVLMDLQRDEAALAVFTQLTQEYPELPDPYNNLALLHARAGRLEAARQALETALRNDPSHRTARVNLGQVHLMLAVQAWEQAAAAAPLELPVQRLLEGARALLAARPAVVTPR